MKIEKEYEIDLLNLIQYIIKKLYSILLIGIVFSILFVGFSGITTHEKYQSTGTITMKTEVADASEIVRKDSYYSKTISKLNLSLSKDEIGDMIVVSSEGMVITITATAESGSLAMRVVTQMMKAVRSDNSDVKKISYASDSVIISQSLGNKKTALIGAFVGVASAGLYWFIVYLLEYVVASKHDVELNLYQTYLGTVDNDCKNDKGLEDISSRILSRNDQVISIVYPKSELERADFGMKLVNELKRNKKKAFYLGVKEFKNQNLSELRAKYDYIIVDHSSDQSNLETIDISSLCDSVIVAICLGKTRLKEVDQLINSLKQKSSNVIGCVLYKNKMVKQNFKITTSIKKKISLYSGAMIFSIVVLVGAKIHLTKPAETPPTITTTYSMIDYVKGDGIDTYVQYMELKGSKNTIYPLEVRKDENGNYYIYFLADSKNGNVGTGILYVNYIKE